MLWHRSASHQTSTWAVRSSRSELRANWTDQNRHRTRPQLVLLWRAGSGPDLSSCCKVNVCDGSSCFFVFVSLVTQLLYSTWENRECCSRTGSDPGRPGSSAGGVHITCTKTRWSSLQRSRVRVQPVALSFPVISELSYQNKAIKNKSLIIAHMKN